MSKDKEKSTTESTATAKLIGGAYALAVVGLLVGGGYAGWNANNAMRDDKTAVTTQSTQLASVEPTSTTVIPGKAPASPE